MYLHLTWIKDIHAFGSRNYRERDWKRENILWNNLGQPAYTGRVRYERGYKTERTPLAQSVYILPSNPADALILT